MTHTKDELLTSRVAKGASPHQPHPMTGRTAHPGNSDQSLNSRDIENMDGVDGNIARAGGVSKHAGMVAPPIHGGMTRQTKTGQTALGGDHASAIDSLSGQVVVPGTPKTEPGWGNQTARSGNPLVKPPGSKAQTPFKIAPGMSAKNTVAAKTSDEHAALGAAILAEAKLGVRGRS